MEATQIVRMHNYQGKAVDILFVRNDDDLTYSMAIIGSNGDGLTNEQLRLSPVPVSVPHNIYTPVGSHSSDVNISSATTLTKPEGASKIIMQALTQNVRFTLDGTTPTTTLGFQLLAGSAPFIIEVPGASLKVIEETATASLQYQWVS